jgi:hypothetical protein
MIMPPKPFDDSFKDMKNAIIGKIIAGPPKPMPLCISLSGRNPSFFSPSAPIVDATSAPYNTSNPIAIPVIIKDAFSAMLIFEI